MKSNHPHFTPPSAAVEQRITGILAKLTLEEKIDLLGGKVCAAQEGGTHGNERAGIPALRFADASVGIHWWTDRSTTYPATIALAATWDRDLAYRAGAALGRDARARGVHVVLGPGVNIYRSALCGRNFEYLGEDPCLASAGGCAFIRGLQDQGVAATVKHLAVNFQEYDRHHTSSDVDERTLREVYLPAFQAAVEDAGSATVMASYNLINGVHASEHDWLIRQLLKGEWGFDGLLMSDWISTYSAVNSANAGLDLEMPTALWLTREHLLPAVSNGLVDVPVIDDKIRRLLRLMICFGWMDHPQQDDSIPLEDPATAAVSLEIARRGCVLLKNEGGHLPLEPGKAGKILLVGPHAALTPVGGGGSALNNSWRRISILDGMRHIYGEENVAHVTGIQPDDSAAAFKSSRFLTPEGEPGLKAEYFNGLSWLGEPVLTRIEPRLEQRWGTGPIADDIDAGAFTVRWTGIVRPERTGPHVFYQWFDGFFRVSVDGQALFDIMDGANINPAKVILHLEAGRDYPIEVLYRRMRQGNGAAVGWAFHSGEVFRAEALRLAREAGHVIFCGGFSEITEGESFDRPFAMPEDHESLLLDLVDLRKDVTVVLTAGGNVDMRRWIERVPAILHAWYPGQEGGTAVAEILAGLVNPSGRLPATFERAPEDRSSFGCYHDADGDKRVLLSDGVFTGYRHHDRTGVAPLFPFGFGLSYTTFAYENLVLPEQVTDGQPLTVRFDVVNTGGRAGIETAQLYLGDVAASVPRPLKELKGFATVSLEPGERRTLEIVLTNRDLQFFCPSRRTWVAEPGEFTVQIGASAADIRLTGRLQYGELERGTK
jgi:beta-glucosidase